MAPPPHKRLRVEHNANNAFGTTMPVANNGTHGQAPLQYAPTTKRRLVDENTVMGSGWPPDHDKPTALKCAASPKGALWAGGGHGAMHRIPLRHLVAPDHSFTMAAHSCIGHVLQPAPVYYAYGYWPEEPMVWQPSEICTECILGSPCAACAELDDWHNLR